MNQPQPANPPQPDDEVGINFIDILFALVVGEALLALNRVLQMPAAGVSHLIFAGVLTITSWIGYHLSAHRYIGAISFNVRVPAGLVHLAKFTLDVILVILYWVAVQTTEWGFSDKGQSPSWRWSTAIATSVFGIYVLWDLLAWRGQGDGRGSWINSRRVVSVMFFIIMLIVLEVAELWSPTSDYGVTFINIILIIVTILYRVAKDSIYLYWVASRVTHPIALPSCVTASHEDLPIAIRKRQMMASHLRCGRCAALLSYEVAESHGVSEDFLTRRTYRSSNMTFRNKFLSSGEQR